MHAINDVLTVLCILCLMVTNNLSINILINMALSLLRLPRCSFLRTQKCKENANNINKIAQR